MKTGPFLDGASEYVAAGWPVVPVEVGGKRIAVDGWTGHDGKYPSRADVRGWIRNFASHNIALRLPVNIVGVDVDAYEDRLGLETLQELESELGALPYTVVSSSRSDGVSGIRLFRVGDAKASWKGKAGPGIDIISWHYRYVVCAPSIHPEGGIYTWYKEDDEGDLVEKYEAPSFDDLPLLPEAWAEFLHRESAGTKTGRLLRADIESWLASAGAGKPCDMISGTADHWIDLLSSAKNDGGAHDYMINGVKALIGDAVAGHPGMFGELARLRSSFMNAVRARRDRNAIDSEWRRAVYGAVRMHYDADIPDIDICEELAIDSFRPRRMNGTLVTPESMKNSAADKEAAKFEKDIVTAIRGMDVHDEARRRRNAVFAAEPPVLMTGAELAAMDIAEPPALVDGLICMDGNTGLVAGAKAGKTTLIHNLVRSVVCGDDFCGAFMVNELPDGKRMTLLDFEMDPAMFRRYLVEDQFHGKSKFLGDFNIAMFKGRKGTFKIIDPRERAKWIEWLTAVNTGYLILDCLSPALGANQLTEDNDDMRVFLDAFEDLVAQCGAIGSMVAHHSGRVGEHARGGTVFDGWVTDEMRLVLPQSEDESDFNSLEKRRTEMRYLSAHGRLATDISQVGLSQLEHRRLIVSGQSMHEDEVEAAEESVVRAIRATPGINVRNIMITANVKKSSVVGTVIRQLLDRDEICVHNGPRNSKIHYETELCPDKSVHVVAKYKSARS